MVKRLMWIGVGAVIGIIVVSKAHAYVVAHTKQQTREFLLGSDEGYEDLTPKTLKALYAEYKMNQQEHEEELAKKFFKKA